MNNNLKGFAYGIATSVTFGLIPLFTLPLMEKGMRFDSILFYRFLFAAIALSGMLLAKKESFRTEMRNLPILILLGRSPVRIDLAGGWTDTSSIVPAMSGFVRNVGRESAYTGAETTWDAMTASALDYTPKDLNLGKMDMSGFVVPVPGKPIDKK